MADNDENKVLRRTALDYRKRVCGAMNFISGHLGRELTLEEIAAAASFSPYHFHRIFRVVVGETVAGFTRRVRLEAAASRLLSRLDDDVTTVAMDCGFSSSQNFAKSFRQRFGMSPTEFRKSKNGTTERKEGNALALGVVYDPDTAFENVPPRTMNMTMNAEVKEMPELHVAYVRKMGPYGKETCQAAFGELMQWAGPRGFAESGQTLGMYWDNPEVTAPEQCRVDACVTVPEGTEVDAPVGIQTIAGGAYAVCRIETKTDNFDEAWQEAFAWVVESGRECAERPCYELYHQIGEMHPAGIWIFDICVPLV